jgi:PhzF family phenazine biosynthesis protein
MSLITVIILSAFTDTGMGGNPAGLVLEADHLTPEMKQAVAAAIGSSETAFVSASRVADYKLTSRPAATSLTAGMPPLPHSVISVNTGC